MFRTPTPFALLALLAACAPEGADPAELELALDDPDEVAEITTPEHPTADGELTRVVPEVDPLPDDVLADRLERAEVAFVGEVVAIAHAEVELPELGLAPHTFVTWRVEEPVKGGVAGEEVTLRFLGGVSEDGATTLQASGIPEFAVGDQDLLFVADGNGRERCPLVDCESGRLRVVGDHLAAPTGHLLVTLEDGRTRFAELLDPTDPVDPTESHDGRPDPEPLGAPLARAELVRRIARPGPAAAALSVTPAHPVR